MRTTRSLDALLPRVRQKVLADLLLRPERRWHAAELARRIEVSPGGLHRELGRLVGAGILLREREGKQVYYRADPACTYLPELQGLLVKTVGVVDELREGLGPLASKIAVAFVYGSLARGEEVASSDVDLLVVGRTSVKELSPALQEIGERLTRQVNATVYPPEELLRKVGAKNAFLRSVLDGPKLFVIGSEGELEEIARGAARRAPGRDQGRDR